MSDDEKEFQIEMLNVQLQHESVNSFLTALMAVTISLAGSFWVLAYSSLSLPSGYSLSRVLDFAAIVMILLFAVLAVTVFALGRWGISRDLEKIREKYVETRNKPKCFKLTILGIELISLEIDET